MKKIFKILCLPVLSLIFMVGFVMSNLSEKKKKKEEKILFDCCGVY